jgi:hypothetical protein
MTAGTSLITLVTRLTVVLCTCVLLGSWLRMPATPQVRDIGSARVRVMPERGRVSEDMLVTVTTSVEGKVFQSPPHRSDRGSWHRSGSILGLQPDLLGTSRLLDTPTAMQWRRPHGELPSAAVNWFSVQAPDGSITAPRQHTHFTTDHGALPVVSLTAHPGAWSDPDSGLLVVGHGIFTAPENIAEYYANDPRWWKYPGNFHGRGKDWERRGHMELIAPDGRLILEASLGLRINGQMTRGFPQHALRLLFDDPVTVPLFPDGDGAGTNALILRSAGNDQVKAMLRDAYQHRLCKDLPFLTSQAMTCVTYLNGAYWGVHHLRQRMDEQEIARRYGISAKKVALLEDRARPAHADSSVSRAFMRLVIATERWDASSPQWLDTLEERLDVQGYLTYMASQMILGNMDWPRQNVKWWRYTGKPRKEAPLDGRWYFIMGDTDLSFGANAPVDVDLFAQVKLANAPISRLFMAMYRNGDLRERFFKTLEELLGGPLSAKRCTHVLDEMVLRMAPEMDRHTARWRKPLDREEWEQEVQVVRAYAVGREEACRRQLSRLTDTQGAR